LSSARASATTPSSLGFYGGAGTVTGSRHLLTAGGHSLLVDCGLFQGLKQLRLLNWQAPPFDPQSVDAAVLTHTHIDHCGAFPRLVRQGYRGDILCSPPTRDVAPVLLMDAARLQEEDAEYANRKVFSKHHPALPLFTADDVRRTLRRLRPVRYGEPHTAVPGGRRPPGGSGASSSAATSAATARHSTATRRRCRPATCSCSSRPTETARTTIRRSRGSCASR
jgi:predicted metal-dependent RNase